MNFNISSELFESYIWKMLKIVTAYLPEIFLC